MAEIALASPMMPPNLMFRGGIEAHHRFLDANGYSGGLELHVTRFTRLSHELANRSMAEEVDNTADFIRSGHQSFVSMEQDMVPHGNAGEVIRAMASVALFPPTDASLQKLEVYQRGVNRDRNLQVVVYPEINHLGGFDNLPFAEKLFQPNIRVLRKWGIRSTDDLVDRAVSEGLTGIAWDGYHYLRTSANGLCMPDWRETLPQFLDHASLMPVCETHVSVGRSDRSDQPELMAATRRELQIFIGEPGRIGTTTTGRMLRMIHDAVDGNMRYVVESRISKDDMPPGMSTADAYAVMAYNLNTYLDS